MATGIRLEPGDLERQVDIIEDQIHPVELESITYNKFRRTFGMGLDIFTDVSKDGVATGAIQSKV